MHIGARSRRHKPALPLQMKRLGQAPQQAQAQRYPGGQPDLQSLWQLPEAPRQYVAPRAPSHFPAFQVHPSSSVGSRLLQTTLGPGLCPAKQHKRGVLPMVGLGEQNCLAP